MQKIIRRLIISNSDSYIACSTKSVEKLIVWNAKKSKIKKVLLTADISKFVIDKKEEVQRKEKCPNLLYVGSIMDRKGIDLLIQALVYVDVEFHLKLIASGDPLYIEEIKCLAREKWIIRKAGVYSIYRRRTIN